jgi:hypothetical protein
LVPRTFQIGRVAKALRLQRWNPHLICADFDDDLHNVFDRGLEELYRPSFSSVVALRDPDFMLKGDPTAVVEPGKFSRWTKWLSGKHTPLEPWIDSAKRAATRWVQRRRHPTVISFKPNCHLVALAVKKAIPETRWVAHFADPWTDNPYDELTGSVLELELQHEREVIDAADAVVFTTNQTIELVMRKYPSSWRSKAHVIPHLLDDDLLSLTNAITPKSKRLRLVHTGSLYAGKRTPKGLFTALRELKQANQDLQLDFRFVGTVPSDAIDRAKSDLQDCISWTTPLYYRPCLREMADADALVVIDTDYEVSPFLPSKLFDYLLFDKPILGLTVPTGETTRFLKQLGYPSVGPNDVEGIKNILMEILRAWRGGHWAPTDAHNQARAEYGLKPGGLRWAQLIESLGSGS